MYFGVLLLNFAFYWRIYGEQTGTGIHKQICLVLAAAILVHCRLAALLVQITTCGQGGFPSPSTCCDGIGLHRMTCKRAREPYWQMDRKNVVFPAPQVVMQCNLSAKDLTTDLRSEWAFIAIRRRLLWCLLLASSSSRRIRGDAKVKLNRRRKLR